jgi:hypothetical protein
LSSEINEATTSNLFRREQLIHHQNQGSYQTGRALQGFKKIIILNLKILFVAVEIV